jgi:hypothetical protein
MKKPLKLIAMGFVLLTAFSAYADALNSERHLEESRKTAQEFVQKLGGVLKAQFETTGAEQAINVCKEVAPALAQEYSHNNKIVKRVSLKNRNPNLGVADDWEVAVLKEFELKNKPDNSTPQEHYEIIENTDGQWFRYMKAIPTQQMCLQCHGKPADIKPNIQARLLKEYPSDKAIGYSVGEIRGAVSIKQKLSEH